MSRRSASSALAFAMLVALAPRAVADELPCVRDDTLERAASALDTPTPDAAAVRHVARVEGASAPLVHAVVTRSSAPEWPPGAAEFVRASDVPVRCGSAVHGDRRVWLLAPAFATVHPQRNEPRVFVVRAHPAYPARYAVVVDAAGAALRLPIDDGVLDLRELDDGPISVQVVGEGPAGPRPIAEWSVGDSSDGADFAIAMDATTTSARVHALREARGASPLRQNALVERVAHEYAERVCGAGRVAHVLEDGESPVDRLRAHGLGARVVGEAVARGATSEAAFQSLVASPAHYAALVDRRFTDVGVADATATDGRACVVVLLAAWPRRLATALR